MSRRKDKYAFHSKSQSLKDSYKQNRYRAQSDSVSPENQPDYRKIRIIKRNLVNAAGLPESIADEELLSKSGYFGRFGNVEKIVLSKNTPYASKHNRNITYNAYITFQTDLEASLAIVVLKSITEALDDYKIEDRTLKVSYGTTKYCSHFTKNQDCPNIMECYYLHEWDVKNQIIVSEENSKQVLYNEQMKIALENIRDNAELILKRKKDCSAKTQFPTIDQTLQQLVKRGIMTSQQLEDLKKTCRKPPERESQPKPKKSNSQSTLATPSKPLQVPSIPIHIDSITCINKMLETNICRHMLGPGRQSQSRFAFAQQSKVADSQADSIKKYVQYHILMNKD